MNINAIQTVLSNTLVTFSFSVLQIITATIAVGCAYLIFKFGWRKIKYSLDTYEGNDMDGFMRSNKRYMRLKGGGRWDSWAPD